MGLRSVLGIAGSAVLASLLGSFLSGAGGMFYLKARSLVARGRGAAISTIRGDPSAAGFIAEYLLSR